MTPPLNPLSSSPSPPLSNTPAELASEGGTTRVRIHSRVRGRSGSSRDYDTDGERDVDLVRPRDLRVVQDAASAVDDAIVLTDEPEALFLSTLRAGNTSRERRRRLLSGSAESMPTNNLATSSERTTALPADVDDPESRANAMSDLDWLVLDPANIYSEWEAQRRVEAAAEEASERATVEAYSRMFAGMRRAGGGLEEGVEERRSETGYWRVSLLACFEFFVTPECRSHSY